MNEATLYQISASTGKGKIWKIRVEDKGTQSEIVIRSGAFNFETLEEGKLITNTAIVSVGKNIGKANETTHYTQAVSEAKAKIELKLREGYDPDPVKASASSSAMLGSGIPKPMLAQKHDPTGIQSSSKTLRQMKLEGKKIIVQPKLDGCRCIVEVKNGRATAYTRKGDVMVIQLDHILNSLVKTVAQSSFDTLIIDGELYCDPETMSFNELNGLIKKQSATTDQLERRKLIKYHIYDVMLAQGYEKRIKIIANFASEHVQVIESKEIIATDSNIQIELERWLELGYEGLMIRQLGMPYENKRSWQLVKVKIFSDEEFELVDVEKDVRGDWVGAFIMKMNTPSKDRDGKPITTFKAGVSGLTQEEGKEIVRNKSQYIGKRATVEYFGLSEYKVPRFPKLKAFRDSM
jgi:ATP-dependent DNA ligase